MSEGLIGHRGWMGVTGYAVPQCSCDGCSNDFKRMHNGIHGMINATQYGMVDLLSPARFREHCISVCAADQNCLLVLLQAARGDKAAMKCYLYNHAQVSLLLNKSVGELHTLHCILGLRVHACEEVCMRAIRA